VFADAEISERVLTIPMLGWTRGEVNALGTDAAKVRTSKSSRLQLEVTPASAQSFLRHAFATHWNMLTGLCAFPHRARTRSTFLKNCSPRRIRARSPKDLILIFIPFVRATSQSITW